MRKSLEIPYMELAKSAIMFAWKRRYLWWFGLFASFLSGGGMNYYHNFNRSSRTEKAIFTKEQIYSFISNNFEWIIAAAFLIFLLLAAFIMLSFLGRGALIASIKKELDGKFSSFWPGMYEGRKNFWRIFSISFSIGLFMLFFFILIASPILFLFMHKSYAAGAILSFIGILILIPVIILASYIKIYGYLYAVIFKLGFWRSVEKAYWLFHHNFWPSIIMGLLFWAANFLFGILMLMAVIPLAIVFFALGMIFYLIGGKIAIFTIATLGILVIVIAATIIRAIYEVFAQTVWIKFFYEIGKAPEEELATETVSAPIPEKPLPIIESD